MNVLKSAGAPRALPKLVLDIVHVFIELIGIFVDRIGDVVNDQFE